MVIFTYFVFLSIYPGWHQERKGVGTSGTTWELWQVKHLPWPSLWHPLLNTPRHSPLCPLPAFILGSDPVEMPHPQALPPTLPVLCQRRSENPRLRWEGPRTHQWRNSAYFATEAPQPSQDQGRVSPLSTHDRKGPSRESEGEGTEKQKMLTLSFTKHLKIPAERMSPWMPPNKPLARPAMGCTAGAGQGVPWPTASSRRDIERLGPQVGARETHLLTVVAELARLPDGFTGAYTHQSDQIVHFK